MESHECLEYFIELARNGAPALASPEAHAAFALAEAVFSDADKLSEDALRGMTIFAAIAHHDVHRARELLYGADGS